MARDDDRIAPTAHYTAYVWHRIGMPHGQLFATPLGASMFWAFRLVGGEGLAALHPTVPSMTQYLELRHRGIERALEALDPDVVVELGAGLSRRGITFAERGTRYVEVDLPEMVALKRRLLARAAPAVRARIEGRLSPVARDVCGEGFDTWLRETLRGAARPAVVAEGLLGYFAPADRRTVARIAAEALDGRGAFLSELRHGGRDDAALAAGVGLLKGGIELVTRGRGTRDDFESLDAVERFLMDAGFAAARPLPPLPRLAHLRLPARVWEATGRDPTAIGP